MPKFDIICLNPPYQKNKIGNGAASGKPFWQNFIELSFPLLKEGGYLCAIHPSTWRFGKVSKRSSIYKAQKLLFSKQLCYLKTFFPFPKMGVMVDFYIAKNSKTIQETEIDFVDGKKFKNISGEPHFVMNYENEILQSIISKCFSQTENNLKTVWGWGGGWKDLNNKYPRSLYKWRKGPNILEKEGLPHIHHFDKKVLGRVSRKVQAIYDAGNLGVGDHNYYLLVDNDIEGKNLELIWNSSLMIFFLKIFSTYFWDGDNTFWNSDTPFKRLFAPKNLSLQNEKDIFDFYKFTKEETEYIKFHLNPNS